MYLHQSKSIIVNGGKLHLFNKTTLGYEKSLTPPYTDQPVQRIYVPPKIAEQKLFARLDKCD